MKDSKLAKLLETFNSLEWRRFRDFVYAPYYNKNTDVMSLFDVLYEIKCFEGCDKEAIFKKAFQDVPYDRQRMGSLMNSLLKLAEQFLAVEEFHREPFRAQRLSLNELSRRKLERHYQFLLKKTKAEQRKKLLDLDKLKQKTELSEIEMVHFSNKKVRRFDESYLQVYSSMNEEYYTRLLKLVCGMLSMQLIVTGNMQLTDLTKQIIESLSANPPASPLIRIYLSIYKMLSRGDDDEESYQHFLGLERFIEEGRDRIDPEEMRVIYISAINFCARRMRQGEREKYAKRVIKLYREGIENKFLFEEDHLPHWTYTNVVKLMLMEREYAEAEVFIRRHKEDLSEDTKADAYIFNKAQLYFDQNEFDKVLDMLAQVNYSENYYNAGSRMLRIKTYFETDLLEPMLSDLAAFTKYLKRNKTMSDAYKQTMLNFCRMLYQVTRVRKEEKKAAVREKISSLQPLAERNWLQNALQKWKAID